VADAPVRPSHVCSFHGCPAVALSRGRCAEHARQRERTRGTAYRRGYTSAPRSPWQVFRRRIVALMLEANRPVVCGSSPPDGPSVAVYSRCLADGVQNGFDLELHHDPPLTNEERQAAARGDRRAFDDPTRVGWLCKSCHAALGDGGFGREQHHAVRTLAGGTAFGGGAEKDLDGVVSETA